MLRRLCRGAAAVRPRARASTAAPATIINGTQLADAVLASVRERVSAVAAQIGRPPSLAVIRVGDDEASALFVRKKRTTATQCGMRCEEHHLPATTTEPQLRRLIEDLNGDTQTDGILLQLPLPQPLRKQVYSLLQRIAASKDVDGLHWQNVGQLMANGVGLPLLQPCTPRGILHLLRHVHQLAQRSGSGFGSKSGKAGFLAGQTAVLVGCSTIVGRPLAMELLARGCTVAITHSQTPRAELCEAVRRSGIVISATGVPQLIPGDWIKPGSVVIDVGCYRTASGALVGDVEFATASKRAGFITPVPGGVGPMTVAYVMHNTVLACQALHGLTVQDDVEDLQLMRC